MTSLTTRTDARTYLTNTGIDGDAPLTDGQYEELIDWLWSGPGRELHDAAVSAELAAGYGAAVVPEVDAFDDALLAAAGEIAGDE